ncbi:MAG: sensor histidine kinase [Bacteroidales bacterium]|nr:sensor histidine kinase [Bacteroidales bacterium]
MAVSAIGQDSLGEEIVEALSKHPRMQLLAAPYGNWLEEDGYRAMLGLMGKGIRPDAVFGQNDRMAMGARRALGDPEDIPFFGVDALPDAGLQEVIDGVLTASYLYPTRGDLVMELALNILQGKPYERENRLESALEGKVDETQRQPLVMARRNVEILRQLVNNILDFRKIESGNMSLEVVRFDLSAAAKEWMTGFEGTDRQLRFEGEDSLVVEADMRLMERILFNLLGNSIKHTAPGGAITVSVGREGLGLYLPDSLEAEGKCAGPGEGGIGLYRALQRGVCRRQYP